MAWANLAPSYQRLERVDEARQAFLRALALDPFDESVQKVFAAFENEGDATPGEEPPPS